MALNDPNFFQTMEKAIIGNTDKFFDYGVKLLETVEPIFAICFGIYLLLWVLNYWANPSFTSMGIDFVKKCITWSIVIALAFNAGNYKNYVANPVYNFGTELTEKIISGTTTPSNGSKENEMDKMKNKVYDAVMTAYENGDKAYSGFKNSGKHLTFNFGIGISHILLIIIIAIAFALILVAKVCLLLVLVTAPFFIGCLLFEPTRQWGTNFINTAFSFVLSIFFYSCIVALLMGVLDNQVVATMNTALATTDGKGLMKAALGLPVIVFIAAAVFVYTMNKIPTITTALTGGNIGGGQGATALGAATMGGAALGARASMGAAGAAGKGAVKGSWAALKWGWNKARQGRVSGG